MDKYYFESRHLVQVWADKTWCIEAPTPEEALEEMKSMLYENQRSVHALDFEFDTITMRQLAPSQNGGFPTMEIHDPSTGTHLWNNVNG